MNLYIPRHSGQLGNLTQLKEIIKLIRQPTHKLRSELLIRLGRHAKIRWFLRSSTWCACINFAHKLAYFSNLLIFCLQAMSLSLPFLLSIQPLKLNNYYTYILLAWAKYKFWLSSSYLKLSLKTAILFYILGVEISLSYKILSHYTYRIYQKRLLGP